MVEGLMSEKSEKNSSEASEEIEQMVQQLDLKHQEKLKEILGTHYEAVRDAYNEYIDTASQEE
jgi:t-SNARE complex subunit (syntaxin)